MANRKNFAIFSVKRTPVIARVSSVGTVVVIVVVLVVNAVLFVLFMALHKWQYFVL